MNITEPNGNDITPPSIDSSELSKSLGIPSPNISIILEALKLINFTDFKKDDKLLCLR